VRTVSVGEAQALHRRLLTGEDPTAPHEVANMYLDNLTEWLIALNPRVHPHDCSTAAENAILTYIKSPQKYRPQRQTPEVYLRVSAKNKLRNILRSERQYMKHLVNMEAADKSPTLERVMNLVRLTKPA
jgi:DNA-directed RNA polymerase specialized sigma24 family protein